MGIYEHLADPSQEKGSFQAPCALDSRAGLHRRRSWQRMPLSSSRSSCSDGENERGKEFQATSMSFGR